MEKAIRIAIDGGYEPLNRIFKDEVGTYAKGGIGMRWLPVDCVYLDPVFWQALGNAKGWEKSMCRKCNRESTKCLKSNDDCTGEDLMGWVYHMHRFIDNIVEGKTIDDFFNSLTK